jgi:hypothetical protein
MAWLITQNSTSMRYLPQFIPTPECPSWALKAAYRDEHGFIPNGIHSAGNFVEARFWPDSGQFRDKTALVPRLMGMCSFFMIPESWLEIIEEFEPGVHQFKHIPLTLKDGSPLEERFYAMNIRKVLANVSDMERSKAIVKEYGNGVWSFVNATDHAKYRVYFLKDKVAGFHLWRPSDVLGYSIAMSEELFARISLLGGMKTIRTFRIEEV